MSGGGNREVDGLVARTLLLALHRVGIEPFGLIHKAAVDLEPVGQRDGRVGWSALAKLVETLEREHGSDGLKRVVHEYALLHPDLRRVATLLLPPVEFYETLLAAMAHTGAQVIELSWSRGRSGVLDCVLSLKPEHRPSLHSVAAVGHFLAGAWATVGTAPARVDNLGHNGNGAHFRVTIPRDPLPTLPVPRAAVEALLASFASQGQRPAPSTNAVPSVAALAQSFALTRAEARVARRLSRGLGTAAIATQLGVSPETVRTHIKRAMQKTETHRQAELVSVVLGLGGSLRDDDDP